MASQEGQRPAPRLSRQSHLFRQRETIGCLCSFERVVSPWPCRCVAPPSVALRAVPRDGDSCPWGGNRLTGAPGVRGGFGAPTGQSQAGGGTEGDPTKDKAEPVSNAALATQPAAVGSTNSVAVCPQLQSRRRMPLPVTTGCYISTPKRPCSNRGALTGTVRNTIARQRPSRRAGTKASEHRPK